MDSFVIHIGLRPLEQALRVACSSSGANWTIPGDEPDAHCTCPSPSTRQASNFSPVHRLNLDISDGITQERGARLVFNSPERI